MKLVVNNESKIGRNDPCNCGSGQKYKKCCYDKDRAEQYNPENFDPISFKREMDLMLREIHGGYDEVEAPKTPKEIAQDLVYEAEEFCDRRLKIAMAEGAMKIYPHLPDAWIILAEEAASTDEEALECYRKAVDAGEKDLGQKFFKENVGYFWGDIKTRPYMRAKVYLAKALWDLGFEDEAIGHYKDCLRLNPNDNQGVRDVLSARMLVKNDLGGVEAIQKKYKENFSTQYCYNRALLLFKKFGADSKRASSQLKKAIERNSIVPKYLLGKAKMPKEIPWAYSMGSKEEAIIYADEAIRAWQETPGALVWLVREQLK